MMKEIVTVKGENVAVEVLERNETNQPIRVEYDSAILRYFKEANDWFIEFEVSPTKTAFTILSVDYVEDVMLIVNDVITRIKEGNLTSLASVINYIHHSCDTCFQRYTLNSQRLINVMTSQVEFKNSLFAFIGDVKDTLGDIEMLLECSVSKLEREE